MQRPTIANSNNSAAGVYVSSRRPKKRLVITSVVAAVLIVQILLIYLVARSESKPVVNINVQPTPMELPVVTDIRPVRPLPIKAFKREAQDVWRRVQSGLCGTLFGNGFKRSLDVCSEPGAISCQRNDRSHATLCTANKLMIDRRAIVVSAGGEPIEEVVGRSEDIEFPVYLSDALAIDTCGDVSSAAGNDKDFPFHLAKMLGSMTSSASPSPCKEYLEGMSLLITRYEYANLYHTMTDWYNAYQAWRMSSAPDEPIRIIFVDGHSQGALDDSWRDIFGVEPVYLSHLPEQVCLRRAVFVPVGYTSSLSVESMDIARSCSSVPQLAEFAKHVVARYELVQSPVQSCSIVFIFRRDYLAHPRIAGRKASRKIGNEDELMSMATERFPTCSVRSAVFEEMSLREQMQSVRSATVLIGMHGAGLSHVVFARPSAALIELTAPEYSGRRHFEMFALYSGARYDRYPVHSENEGFHHVPAEGLMTHIEKFIP